MRLILARIPHGSQRSSVRRASHPISPLPGHLADQTTRFHLGEVAVALSFK